MDDGEAAGLRRLTDARELRALAHPTRIALLEALALKGTLTATEAAQAVGGNASNVSYHLRTLAGYGYVVEAEGGSGRERPWKLGRVGTSFDEDAADPAAALAADALSDVVSERWWSRRQEFRRRRAQYPADVRAVSGESQFVLFCTPEEVEQIQAKVFAELLAYRHRVEESSARPVGAKAFEVVVATSPFELIAPAPESGADDHEG